MKLRTIALMAALISALFTGACTQGKGREIPPTDSGTHSEHTALHAHGPTESKLGLQPAVIDGLMEVTDAALIVDGALVAVDLPNTLNGLHGGLFVLGDDRIVLDVDGQSVTWSSSETDLPGLGRIPGPVKWEGNRLRMPAEQFGQFYGLMFPTGKFEVKDGKLHLTTGR